MKMISANSLKKYSLRKNKPIVSNRSLQQQLDYQKKLIAITNRIHSAENTNEILENLQDEVLTLFNADRITIYAVDPNGKEIFSRFKTGNEINEFRVPINDKSISGYCAESRKLINVQDAYDNADLMNRNPRLSFDSSWDKKTGYKTSQILVAPIMHNKFLLGVVQLINKKDGDHFTKADQDAVVGIAKVLGIAFSKNRQLAQKKRPTKYDLLITNNIISSKELFKAMSKARKTNQTIESVLIAHFHVSKTDIGKSLSQFYKVPFIQYEENMAIPHKLLKGLRPTYLRYNGFIPVRQFGNKAVIAMVDPQYLPVRDSIMRLIPANEYEYCVSLQEDVSRMIEHFFDEHRNKAMAETNSIEAILEQLASLEDEDEDLDVVSEDDSTIVQLVNKMIIDAYNRGASDIHIEPRPGKTPAIIRIRVDGVCQIYKTVPHTCKRAIISRIKIMSDLDIAEKRLPQDGKIALKKHTPLNIELRVATIPTANQNEDVVLRILPSGRHFSLDSLQMRENDLNAFKDMMTKPYGIILVVGPTGSGKTATLHAAMHYINNPERKIWTAEDPIEITQDGLRQVQVHPKIGFTFATAMRAFLRADPDVIMVGEMRDHETMSTGIEASLTGHLVLSTLHTNNAPETITRLLDMGMDPYNFADALLGILSQRLVRTLCTECKVKYKPNKIEFDDLARAYEGDFDALGFKYDDDCFLYRPKGCQKCGNSGYLGRVGLFETLIGTDQVKSLIQTHASIEDLRRQAIKDGMSTLMQDGIRKVCLGLTDLKQVRRVCIR